MSTMANQHVSRKAIESEVRAALAATLSMDADAIDMSKSIITELGASSIDFLDINFRLESAFGIQLATLLILDHVEEQVGEGKAIDANDEITEPAAELLKLYFGELPGLEAGISADSVPALVTPAIVADGVERILEQLPEACTCGASDWKPKDGKKVACSACDAGAEYPNGDDLIEAWIKEVQAERNLFPSA